MYDKPSVIELLAHDGAPAHVTVGCHDPKQSLYSISRGQRNVEVYDVSLDNAVRRVSEMLAHYPAPATVNGHPVPTTPFPNLGHVAIRRWHGLHCSATKYPTAPAPSQPCFNAYAAGVLCQLPDLEIPPYEYLVAEHSPQQHWDDVAGYAITPVAQIDAQQLDRINHQGVFLPVRENFPKMNRELVEQARVQAHRTIAVCNLPEAIDRSTWILPVENQPDEISCSAVENVPVVPKAPPALIAIIPNHAENVSAVANLVRCNFGYTPVVSVHRTVEPHQPAANVLKLSFNTSGAGFPSLEITDVAVSSNTALVVTPEVYATGVYPHSHHARVHPRTTFTLDQLAELLFRCYRRDAADHLGIPHKRLKPWTTAGRALQNEMRDYARTILQNRPEPAS